MRPIPHPMPLLPTTIGTGSPIERHDSCGSARSKRSSRPSTASQPGVTTTIICVERAKTGGAAAGNTAGRHAVIRGAKHNTKSAGLFIKGSVRQDGSQFEQAFPASDRNFVVWLQTCHQQSHSSLIGPVDYAWR